MAPAGCLCSKYTVPLWLFQQCRLMELGGLLMQLESIQWYALIVKCLSSTSYAVGTECSLD